MRKIVFAALVAVLVVVVMAAVTDTAQGSTPWTSPGLVYRSAIAAALAQDTPAATGPFGRVLFAPELSRLSRGGTACVCGGWGAEGPTSCACDPAHPAMEAVAVHAGVRVQNVGEQETRFAMAYHGPSTADVPSDCDSCTFVGISCSQPVSPGHAWAFPHVWMGSDPTRPATATAAAAASVYSLNTAKVVDQGADWSEWLAASGLPADTTMADLVCSPAPDDCSGFQAFHDAYVAPHGGTFPGTELPIDALRGEPISGVVAVIGTGDSADKQVIDRYATLTLDEAVADDAAEAHGPQVTAATDGLHAYAAPGGYGFTLDGYHSYVALQNTTSSCATVTVTAHRNFHGQDRHKASIVVPPNSVRRIDVRDEWPDLIEMATYRATSDQPLAVTMSSVNFATSVTSSARRERTNATRWSVPRAYQERRPVLLADGNMSWAGRVWPPDTRSLVHDLWGPDRHDVLYRMYVPRTGQETGYAVGAAEGFGADGWQTNVAMFNPGDVPQEALMRMQASGEPPAEIWYPVDALAQLVLQPGFRLGLDGGPGWMEIESSGELPLGVAVESLRDAANLEGLTVEAWAAAGVPHESGTSGARTIGLADLGGPAIGEVAAEGIISRTVGMTDTLRTRINIQNPFTQTARVTIDSFAPGCGYVGSVARTIDPRQTIVVGAGDLPGTRFGGNAAVVRVLEGGAAAFVEIARAERMPATIRNPPIDVTNAYGGAMSLLVMPSPRAVTATMAVTPTDLVYELGDVLTPFDVSIAVSDTERTGRCLLYDAVSDVAWISVGGGVGAIPGQLTLSIDPARAIQGRRNDGTVTLTSAVPAVRGSPAVVKVKLIFPAEPALLLPYAGRSSL